jgi:hypothetical protein
LSIAQHECTASAIDARHRHCSISIDDSALHLYIKKNTFTFKLCNLNKNTFGILRLSFQNGGKMFSAIP